MASELEIDEREVIDTGEDDGAEHQYGINGPSQNHGLLDAPLVETAVFQHHVGEHEQAEEEPHLGVDGELLSRAELTEGSGEHRLHVAEVGGAEQYPEQGDEEEGLGDTDDVDQHLDQSAVCLSFYIGLRRGSLGLP